MIETRSLIINLYLTCEVNYVNGLNIYEAIVDQKIYDTLQNQTKNLEKKLEEIYIEDEIPESAELKNMKNNTGNPEDKTGKPEENTENPEDNTENPEDKTGKPEDNENSPK